LVTPAFFAGLMAIESKSRIANGALVIAEKADHFLFTVTFVGDIACTSSCGIPPAEVSCGVDEKGER